MADNDRATVRLPADYAAEMQEVSKRTGIPLAHMVRVGWEAVRDRFMRMSEIPTTNDNAIYAKQSKRK